MSQAQQYEMKDSGVEWIGQIPEGWNLSAVKRHYSITLGKMLESLPQTHDATLENYMCASNLKWGGIDVSTNRQMWFSETEKEEYLLEDGDLLVMEGGSAGTSSIYHGEFSPCYMQNSVNRCRSKDGSMTQFLYYWMFLVYHSGHVESACNRATIMHLTKEKLGRLSFVHIPLPEQAAIASYLDDKCATIDTIIAEAKATIEEYKAWKASVIFEAVTKGLNPDAEMKDSGVEWIGKIPKGWNIRKIKSICRLKTGCTPDTSHLEWFNGNVLWYTPGDFSEHYLLGSSLRTLSEQATSDNVAVKIPKNSVLLVGIGATAGKVGYAQFECSINQQITALIPFNMSSKYLMYYLISSAKTIKELANYTTLPIINNSTLGNFVVMAPPFPEQEAIAAYLDDKCATIDGVIAEKEALIAELESYKKSLIFETVTGKRKVV